MTIAPPDSPHKPENPEFRQLLAVFALIAAMTALRLAYAGLTDLRTDEAYYWTWSKESVLCFLDHPPMIAWFIRIGTLIFGDTNFGVRFAGLVAMPVTQLLLADIVRRLTHDWRAMVIVVLIYVFSRPDLSRLGQGRPVVGSRRRDRGDRRIDAGSAARDVPRSGGG